MYIDIAFVNLKNSNKYDLALLKICYMYHDFVKKKMLISSFTIIHILPRFLYVSKYETYLMYDF